MIIRILVGLSLLFSSTNVLKAQEKNPTFVASQNTLQLFTDYEPIRDGQLPHPDFILPSIEGDQSIQLSKYRGQKVLLLHFASW